jgi:hypothetical protein
MKHEIITPFYRKTVKINEYNVTFKPLPGSKVYLLAPALKLAPKLESGGLDLTAEELDAVLSLAETVIDKWDFGPDGEEPLEITRENIGLFQFTDLMKILTNSIMMAFPKGELEDFLASSETEQTPKS